jgi:hemin uptake protein HemP
MTQVEPESRPEPDSLAPADSASPSPPAAKMLCSEELFEGRKEVFIQHGHALYRLRITSQGRLILTK